MKHEKNEHDQFAIGIFLNRESWAMFLNAVVKFLYQFPSLAGCIVEAKATEKRMDRRGRYGSEIIVCYKYSGPEKIYKWIQTKMKKIKGNILNMIKYILGNSFPSLSALESHFEGKIIHSWKGIRFIDRLLYTCLLYKDSFKGLTGIHSVHSFTIRFNECPSLEIILYP